MVRNLMGFLSFLAVSLVAVPASAATYLFSITTLPSYGSPFPTATFQLPDQPTPGASDSFSFTIFGIPVAGTSQFGPVTYAADYTFYAGEDLNGGLSDGSYYNFYGAQLFTGNLTAPTFKLGTFDLYDDPGADPVGTLVISAEASAVPEPAAWATMLCGLGMIGGAMRRRTRADMRAA